MTPPTAPVPASPGMPELPEVETVRQGLQRHVVGRTIDKVSVLHPRAVRRHLAGPADFSDALAGRPASGAPPPRQVPVAAGRCGRPAGPPGHERPAAGRRPRPPAVAARPGGVHVHRRRPGPALHRSADLRSSALRAGRGRAPGPDRPHRPRPARRRLRRRGGRRPRRRTGITRALLDQSLISGVGNIYADEALWRAQLHYARATDTLTRPEI